MSDSRVVGQPTVPGVCDTNSLAHIIGAIPLISQIIFFSSISSVALGNLLGRCGGKRLSPPIPARSTSERGPSGRECSVTVRNINRIVNPLPRSFGARAGSTNVLTDLPAASAVGKWEQGRGELLGLRVQATLKGRPRGGGLITVWLQVWIFPGPPRSRGRAAVHSPAD
jgi:hypothetical protein